MFCDKANDLNESLKSSSNAKSAALPEEPATGIESGFMLFG